MNKQGNNFSFFFCEKETNFELTSVELSVGEEKVRVWSGVPYEQLERGVFKGHVSRCHFVVIPQQAKKVDGIYPNALAETSRGDVYTCRLAGQTNMY